MRSFTEESLRSVAERRAPGYLDDVLRSAAKVENGRVWLSDEAFDRIRRQYDKGRSAGARPARPPGPGSQLKSLLAKFGIHASPTCKCNSMARKMDAWGPDESLNHLEEIVDVMQETAEKRGLPFLRTAAKLLVRRAISKSRAMISKGKR